MNGDTHSKNKTRTETKRLSEAMNNCRPLHLTSKTEDVLRDNDGLGIVNRSVSLASYFPGRWGSRLCEETRGVSYPKLDTNDSSFPSTILNTTLPFLPSVRHMHPSPQSNTLFLGGRRTDGLTRSGSLPISREMNCNSAGYEKRALGRKRHSFNMGSDKTVHSLARPTERAPQTQTSRTGLLARSRVGQRRRSFSRPSGRTWHNYPKNRSGQEETPPNNPDLPLFSTNPSQHPVLVFGRRIPEKEKKTNHHGEHQQLRLLCSISGGSLPESV
ncbi:hypothetical protein B0T20DRAFT_272524 [Sordaria brevicollis]|uniref:Uncharacterized protein n=1 Tax=Sordaria brevicollis TaxID=83679 RepID=A0AAE0PAU7_SORBR|nr:hypothetical protein B0T20DRAFT_272524 [Sordaria brevicollis]